MRAQDVSDRDSLQQYIEQQLGVGHVTGRDQAAYRKKVDEFFEHYPNASWGTLVRVVDWAKARRKRFARLHAVVEAARYAYADGYLPELDPRNHIDVDAEIIGALKTETDPLWRRRLMVAQGIDAKTMVLEEWQSERLASR